MIYTYEVIGTIQNPTVVKKDQLIINGHRIQIGVSGFTLDCIVADINDAGLPGIDAYATNDNRLCIRFSTRKRNYVYHISSASGNYKLGLPEIYKKANQKKNLNKVFIISQPKAGTYLCSNLLMNFNLKATGMHIKNNKARVYNPSKPVKFETKKELKKFMQESTIHKQRFADLVQLIPGNGFAVGHLEPEKKYINGLAPCKKILLLRPHEEHLESLKRFYGNTSVSKKEYENISNWQHLENVFVINFHDMINSNIDVINSLQLFLFDEIKFDSQKAIRDALASPSLTKSDIR